MRGRSRVRDEDNTGVRSEPSTTNAAAVISAPVQSLLQRQHCERSNEPDCNANRIHASERSGGTIGHARSLVREPAVRDRGSPPTLVRHTDSSGTAVAEEKGSARRLESPQWRWRIDSRPSQCRDISQRLASEPNELNRRRMRRQVHRNSYRRSRTLFWGWMTSKWRRQRIGKMWIGKSRNADASSRRILGADPVNRGRSNHRRRSLMPCLAWGRPRFGGAFHPRERPGKLAA